MICVECKFCVAQYIPYDTGYECVHPKKVKYRWRRSVPPEVNPEQPACELAVPEIKRDR